MHAKIRESPLPKKKEGEKKFPSQPKRKQPKLTYDERKQRLKVRLPLSLSCPDSMGLCQSC